MVARTLVISIGVIFMLNFQYPVYHFPPVWIFSHFSLSFSLQSPNKPTQPQEKIRPLTSLDHPQSPFYDPEGGSIKSVARVVIERIARKVTNAHSDGTWGILLTSGPYIVPSHKS